jgi:hypothetical protein
MRFYFPTIITIIIITILARLLQLCCLFSLYTGFNPILRFASVFLLNRSVGAPFLSFLNSEPEPGLVFLLLETPFCALLSAKSPVRFWPLLPT